MIMPLFQLHHPSCIVPGLSSQPQHSSPIILTPSSHPHCPNSIILAPSSQLHCPCEWCVEQTFIPSQYLLQAGLSQRSALNSGLVGKDAEHSIAGLERNPWGGGQWYCGFPNWPQTLKTIVCMPTHYQELCCLAPAVLEMLASDNVTHLPIYKNYMAVTYSNACVSVHLSVHINMRCS